MILHKEIDLAEIFPSLTDELLVLVEIEIANFYPGREDKIYGPPETCYPADPADWDQYPVECGAMIQRKLFLVAGVEISQEEAQTAMDTYISNLDLTDEVMSEYAAQMEYAAEERAERMES